MIRLRSLSPGDPPDAEEAREEFPRAGRSLLQAGIPMLLRGGFYPVIRKSTNNE
jgi:hypothetical protein